MELPTTGRAKTETFHKPDTVGEFYISSRPRCLGQCHAKYVETMYARDAELTFVQINIRRGTRVHDITVAMSLLTKQRGCVKSGLWKRSG